MSSKRFFAVAVVLGFAGYCLAQEYTPPVDLSKPADLKEEHTSGYRGELDAKSTKAVRGSEVIGKNVMTPDNETTIGEVNDIMIDTESGKVKYVAVSVGGFLGVGDKLVAVPWQSFECRKDADGNSYISLDTTREQLEKAPGIDQNNWPEEPTWSTEK